MLLRVLWYAKEREDITIRLPLRGYVFLLLEWKNCLIGFPSFFFLLSPFEVRNSSRKRFFWDWDLKSEMLLWVIEGERCDINRAILNRQWIRRFKRKETKRRLGRRKRNKTLFKLFYASSQNTDSDSLSPSLSLSLSLSLILSLSLSFGCIFLLVECCCLTLEYFPIERSQQHQKYYHLPHAEMGHKIKGRKWFNPLSHYHSNEIDESS